MITYIRTVDKWKINPTPQTMPFGRLKKPNILEIVVILMWTTCVYLSAFCQHNPPFINTRVWITRFFVATKKKKVEYFLCCACLAI